MRIIDVYLDFMNKGLNFLKNSNYDIYLNEPNFVQFMSVTNFIKDQFHDIIIAFEISFL